MIGQSGEAVEWESVTDCSCRVARHYHQRGRWYGQRSSQTLCFNQPEERGGMLLLLTSAANHDYSGSHDK